MSSCADDVSISGFKDAISEQSTTESATEAVIGQEHEGGVSPDTVSATSQSIDEPTKDIVRYCNQPHCDNLRNSFALQVITFCFCTCRFQSWY